MIFSFFWFIMFLLLILGVYYIVPVKLKRGWLLLSSYAFCLGYGINSLYVLACSTIGSYLFGIMIGSAKSRQPGSKRALACLWIGVVFCIIPLLLWKMNQYSLFASIGISFYLLQEIGYLVDIYLGKCYAEKNIVHYALFIAFFPKLVSGPIERSSSLLKQIEEMPKKTFDYENIKKGFLLMLWGYFQKSIIADSLAVFVTTVYDHWEGYAGGTLCLASIAFAFQLYADFAGYTNIAMGAAQVLGFCLTPNFRQPYLSGSIKEFWHRWHISLSAWLRDYIYIPLGGSRRGIAHQCVNLLITFLVSGVWHGTGLNFLAWGMLHGFFQVMEGVCSKIQIFKGKQKGFLKAVKMIWVFMLVDLAWVFFRASGLRTALGILHQIIFKFTADKVIKDLALSLNLGFIQVFVGISGILLLLAVDLLHEKGFCIRESISRKPIAVRWICYMGIVAALTVVGMRRWGMDASGFIYMRF